MTNKPFRDDFAHVDTWVFDLDKTLYPHEADLFPQAIERITGFIGMFLSLPHHEALSVQRDYSKRYGTALTGLIEHHDVDIKSFLDYVHDLDYSTISPNPALGQAIAKLPGRKLILTNADQGHSERTLARLGIRDHFEAIFDVVAADMIPKPERQTYEKFNAMHGVDPMRAVMFEDMSCNLVAPKQLGMKTVLVTPKDDSHPNTQSWSINEADKPSIDHQSNDLVSFLNGMSAK